MDITELKQRLESERSDLVQAMLELADDPSKAEDGYWIDMVDSVGRRLTDIASELE